MEERIDRLYQQDDVPLHNIASRQLKQLLYLALLLLLIFIAGGILIKVPDEAELPVLLKGKGSEYTCRFYEPVYVVQIFTENGQDIQAGDTLAYVQSASISRYLEERSRLQQQLLSLQQEATPVKAQQAVWQLRQTEARRLYRKSQANLQQLMLRKSQVETELGRQLKQQEAQYSRQSSLAKEELISEEALEQAEQALASLRQQWREKELALEQAVSREEQNSLEQASRQALAEQELQKLQLDYSHRLQQARDALQLLEQQLNQQFGPQATDGRGLFLLSPQAGQLTYIAGPTQTTRELARIRQDSLSLYAEGPISQQVAGRLKTGLPAHIQLESFPHLRFGSLPARLYSLSQSPNEAGQFEARFQLGTSSAFEGKLQNGLAGKARVLLEEHSLFAYLYLQFVKN